VAGVNAGDGTNFITIPGSLSLGVLKLNETSNVGDPGVWIFEVDTGIAICTVHSVLLYLE